MACAPWPESTLVDAPAICGLLLVQLCSASYSWRSWPPRCRSRRRRRPRAGRAGRARSTASTAAPHSACCAARWRSARGRPARPRRAGSRARLRKLLPHGRYQAVPGGLRNVVGTVPRQRPAATSCGRPLRHQGHPGLRRRQRRRRRHGRGRAARPRARARATRSTFIALRRRGDAARRPGPTTSTSAACAAARSPRRATDDARRWSCSTSSATGACASRARRTRTPGCGPAARRRPRARASAGTSPTPPQRRRSSTTTRRSCAAGVPSIDLIDFDFPCWHARCDDLVRRLRAQPRRQWGGGRASCSATL